MSKKKKPTPPPEDILKLQDPMSASRPNFLHDLKKATKRKAPSSSPGQE